MPAAIIAMEFVKLAVLYFETVLGFHWILQPFIAPF